MLHSLLGLVLSFGLTLLTAVIGGLSARGAMPFYDSLFKPKWAPPAKLFGPIWTVLYLLMAIAAWIVWNRGAVANVKLALILFIFQLVLNGFWSWLFFTLRSGVLALMDILGLAVLILLTIMMFWRVVPVAGFLLIPYFVWVMFAASLNSALNSLNPEVLIKS